MWEFDVQEGMNAVQTSKKKVNKKYSNFIHNIVTNNVKVVIKYT